MNTEEAITHFPILAAVVGENWMRQNPNWFEAQSMPLLPVWYDLANKDLTALQPLVRLSRLAQCYRPMLQSGTGLIETLYEIHCAAILGTISARLDLHVPKARGIATNFDVRAEIAGYAVNADCKTRRDRFPFNMPKVVDEDGFTSYHGSRASLDPHDAELLGMPRNSHPDDPCHRETPESTVLRQLLLEALTQLPDSGMNVVLLGHVHGDRRDLERALFEGAPVCDFVRDHTTKEVWTEWRQVGSVAFGDEAFRRLSGVLWVRLLHIEGPIERRYKLYANPYADSPLPLPVAEALERLSANPTTHP